MPNSQLVFWAGGVLVGDFKPQRHRGTEFVDVLGASLCLWGGSAWGEVSEGLWEGRVGLGVKGADLPQRHRATEGFFSGFLVLWWRLVLGRCLVLKMGGLRVAVGVVWGGVVLGEGL